eukprot:3885525-Prymnesium_polylepis.1
MPRNPSPQKTCWERAATPPPARRRRARTASTSSSMPPVDSAPVQNSAPELMQMYQNIAECLNTNSRLVLEMYPEREPEVIELSGKGSRKRKKGGADAVRSPAHEPRTRVPSRSRCPPTAVAPARRSRRPSRWPSRRRPWAAARGPPPVY